MVTGGIYMGKKIILPNDDEVNIYGNKKPKIIIPPQNPMDNIEIKNIEKEAKNRGKFCSNVKVFLNWKEMVKNILNNTDYGDDKR